MPTTRDDVLPDLDGARAEVDATGLRRYAVTIRTRTWSGGAPGVGTATNSDLPITPRPRVRDLSAREVASSGGTFSAGDMRLDRITPRYTTPTTGGYTPEQLNPPVSAANQDVVVVLTGDDGVMLATVVAVNFDRSFGYSLVVRPRRETP